MLPLVVHQNFCMGVSEVNTSGHPVQKLGPWTTPSRSQATLAKVGTPYQYQNLYPVRVGRVGGGRDWHDTR